MLPFSLQPRCTTTKDVSAALSYLHVVCTLTSMSMDVHHFKRLQVNYSAIQGKCNTFRAYIASYHPPRAVIEQWLNENEELPPCSVTNRLTTMVYSVDELNRVLENDTLEQLMARILVWNGLFTRRPFCWVRNVTSTRTYLYAYLGTDSNWKCLDMSILRHLFLVAFARVHALCMEWWEKEWPPGDVFRTERIRNKISTFSCTCEAEFQRFYRTLIDQLPDLLQ